MALLPGFAALISGLNGPTLLPLLAEGISEISCAGVTGPSSVESGPFWLCFVLEGGAVGGLMDINSRGRRGVSMKRTVFARFAGRL